MSNPLLALKTLPNPLRSSFVGDPWAVNDDDSNVSEIHLDVFNTCLAAVEEARDASCSAGIVIHGQAGSGKTHLIGRLRQRLIDCSPTPQLEQKSQAFAYIKLNTNAGSITRHVRHSVAIDLLRPQKPGWSQFQRMVISRLMEVANGNADMAWWWDYFLDERAEKELGNLLQQLQSSESLSPAFVRVLGHMFRRQHLLEVQSWLRGEAMSGAALARLDLGAEADDDPELLSLNMLIDFMRLAGSKIPLVLCFDQIEALQTSPDDVASYERFGRLLADLANADPNLVLISCLQSSRFEQLSAAIPGYAMDRIQSRATLSLNPLNIRQATALLAQRLKPLKEIRPDDASDIWPLTPQDIEQIVGQTGCSARELIVSAARIIESLRSGGAVASPTGHIQTNNSIRPVGIHEPQAVEDQIGQWLAEEWDRREEQAQQSNQPESTQAILDDGIPRLLNVIAPDWKVAPSKQADALDYIVTAPLNEGLVGIKVCEETGNALSSQMRKLSTSFPTKLNLQKLVLLRDERRPISTNAVKTHEYLATLQKNDAVYFPVGPQTAAALDALRLLLADAAAGDLAWGVETIETDRVLNWLRSHLPNSLKELADILVAPTPIAGGNGEKGTHPFLPPLQEWLTEHCLARWSDALEAIQVTGKQADELLSAAEARADLFGIVHGDPTVIFSTRLASPVVTTHEA